MAKSCLHWLLCCQTRLMSPSKDETGDTCEYFHKNIVKLDSTP